MTPSKLRELFSESKDRVDVEEYMEVIEYVHDDGHPGHEPPR